MIHSVNTYFTSEECSEIIDYCMKNGEMFSYDPKENWDCRRIYFNNFKESIIDKFKTLYDSNQTNYWFDFNDFDINYVNISLTRYYDGRFLNLHKDVTSQFTTVIVLTENFNDGRFVLSERVGNNIKDMVDDSLKLDLSIGQGISFDGSKIYHGVMPVYEGIRCALNVWMSDETPKTTHLKNNKTLL